MIGYFYTAITSTENMLVESQKMVKELTGKEAENRGILFSPVSPYFGPLDADTQEMSILSPLPEEVLENAVIFSPVRYFSDPYGAAFLIHVYNAVRENGWIAVPYYSEKKANLTGFWNLTWLESVLGKPYQFIEDKNIALFRRTDSKTLPKSIVSFFLREGSACALDFFKDRTRASTENYIKRCANFITPPIFPLIQNDCMSDGHVDLNDEQDLFFSNMNYSVTGTAYKVAGIRRLLEQYLPEQDGLRVVDIGGGVGFVGVELLLSCSKVSHVINCEPMSGNIPMARRLYNWFEPRLKDRFQMSPSVAQTYPFDKSIDMMCAFASLLYIPREHLEGILRRAWNALKPGGIFVIHENIKRSFFETKNYYNQMFSVEELEKYLVQFGTIDYYRSSDLQKMDRENVQDLTVFRVIQKGSS